MFVISSSTPFSVAEAQAMRESQPLPFGIGCVVGGPNGAPWEFALISELGEQGFPRVGVWSGSNPDGWVEDYSTEMARAHAERAWQDVQRVGMADAPLALDVRSSIPEHLLYAREWAHVYDGLGGRPWVYGSGVTCVELVPDCEGIWYPIRSTELTDVEPPRGTAYRLLDNPFGMDMGGLVFSLFNDNDVVATVTV